MNVLWRSLMTVAVFALLGCQGELPGDDKPIDPKVDPNAPCTDPAKCCPKDKMKCYGDPDKGIVCTCSDLWDCSKNPNKCDQEAPTPDGGTGWDCEWTEFTYTCEKKGDKNNPPDVPGGGDWYCKYDDNEQAWKCTKKSPPNPTNKPEGTSAWKCKVENGQLVCERKDGPVPPPTGGGQWKCDSAKDNCEKLDENKGLPPGGSNWKCNKTTKNGVATWVCYGESSTPPGGNGWNCTKMKTEFGKDIWKCEKPEGPGDTPPGGGYWSCVKGSEFNGTKCEKVDKPPTPPGPTPTPGSKCKINEKMWCDGLVYCGWGQVDCDPKTGTWRVKNVNGKVMLDCQESMAGGKVPNTVCACYHFFFNPSCCERKDCIVPPGSKGQNCPKSAGKLCDYCNPMKPECVGKGAKCIVTNAHETFCGRECSKKPCPSGYTCMTVKLKVGTTKQCVPNDYSCYY
jgi:hypothetical protein